MVRMLLMLGLLGTTGFNLTAAFGERDTNSVTASSPKKGTDLGRSLALDLSDKENWIVTHPTCLCPRPSDGGSLEERLTMVRSCLNSFLEQFKTEITDLNRAEFFAGRITDYDEHTMRILHKIFSNEGRGKNWNSIILDFRDWSKYLLADINDLKSLVSEKETQRTTVKKLLDDIRTPLIVVSRSVHYYGKHAEIFLRLVE